MNLKKICRLLRKHGGRVLKYIIQSAEITAAKLISHNPAMASDRDDIKQGIILHALANRSKYNESRASEKTFISKVIKNKALNIVRDSQKQSIQIDTDLIPDKEQPNPDFLYDIHEIISKLPPKQAKFAQMIMDGYNRREIAKALKISVSVLYSVCLPKIRAAFKDFHDLSGKKH